MTDSVIVPILATRGEAPLPPTRVRLMPTREDRRRADSSHGQSLERLAARGGVTWRELWCIVHDRPWSAEEAPIGAEARDAVLRLDRVEIA